jgi:predicted alpha/beta superfamily hydrolase
MHRLLVVPLLLLVYASTAQHKVTLEVVSLPAYHKGGDPVFVAGSFNNWLPASEEYRFKQGASGRYAIELRLPAGRHEFKLTRGSWPQGEYGTTDGIPNRVLTITRDTVVQLGVKNWTDHFAGPKKSTASSNVRILATSFFIPQLNRYRRIWVYLPPGYGSSRKRYPVLYMHDGQNLFEDTTSYSGEWGVDEAMDSLENPRQEMIVVGIDNGGATRTNEYSPLDMERFGKGEGDQYVEFLVKTLRPYINRNFRTDRRNRSNYIAGSSMGGLISFWAMLRQRRKWGGAGVFSPAFWVVPGLEKELQSRARKVKGRIYFFAGKGESERMVPDMLTMFNGMATRSKAKLTTVIRAEGKHNEATWRKEFPLFQQWILGR